MKINPNGILTKAIFPVIMTLPFLFTQETGAANTHIFSKIRHTPLKRSFHLLKENDSYKRAYHTKIEENDWDKNTGFHKRESNCFKSEFKNNFNNELMSLEKTKKEGEFMTLLRELKNKKIIDLTHSLKPSIPTWTGACGFAQELLHNYDPDGLRVQSINALAGAGTHIDAPSHFYKGMRDVSQYPHDQFFFEGAVIDVSQKVQKNENYLITVDDILNHEKSYGKLSIATLALFNTGWHTHWLDAKKYRNENKNGTMIFPGVSLQATNLLLERGVVSFGIDTLSPDQSDLNFPVHKLWLGAGNTIIENLNFNGKLPPRGSIVINLPQKIEHGTEASTRIIALVDNKD